MVRKITSTGNVMTRSVIIERRGLGSGFFDCIEYGGRAW